MIRSSRARVTALVSVPFVLGTVFGHFLPAFSAGSSATLTYSDVKPGDWFEGDVSTLVDAGILLKGDGKFKPDGKWTNAEQAAVLARMYAKLGGYVSTGGGDSGGGGGDSSVSSTVTSRSRRSTSKKSSSTSSSSKSSSEAGTGPAGPEGSFKFSTTAYSIPETAKGLTLGIMRTGGSKGPVSVSFDTLAATATENDDYYKNGGKIDFKEGETTKTFTILMKNDDKAEGPETLTVKLSSPVGGAVLGTPHVATVTIIDDERGSGGSSSSTTGGSSVSAANPAAGTFNLSAIGYSVSEKTPTITITVTRDNGSTGNATVNYATSNNTAKSGSEYVSANGTLTFAQGETTKNFQVQIADNGAIGGNKTFNIKLSTPTGGAGIGRRSDSVVTIVDDEAGTYGSGSLKLSKSSYDGSEIAGYAYLLVQRVGGAKGTATVSYNTQSGTASGNDFTPANGSLIFLDGESTKEIPVAIVKDSLADSGETFYLNLSSPVGAALGSPNSATVTIYE